VKKARTMTTKKRRRRKRRRKRKRKKVGSFLCQFPALPEATQRERLIEPFDDNTDWSHSAAPAAKKRKTGPETSTNADTSAAAADTRVKGTKATVTDPNTYQAEKGIVVDDGEEDGEAEAEPDEEDDEDEEEEDDDGEEDDEEGEGDDDEPAVKTKVVKGSDAKAVPAEAETEDFDDED
jgi:hypothetical protein